MKALLRLIADLGGGGEISAPDNVFDRFRADARASAANPETRKEER